METAALCKPWKNQKAVFPPFAHRLENSPQKARVEFSTVPTAPAATFLLKKETGEKRADPAISNRSWVEGVKAPGRPEYRCWPSRQSASRPAREWFFLDFPFHRTEFHSETPRTLSTQRDSISRTGLLLGVSFPRTMIDPFEKISLVIFDLEALQHRQVFFFERSPRVMTLLVLDVARDLAQV